MKQHLLFALETIGGAALLASLFFVIAMYLVAFTPNG